MANTDDLIMNAADRWRNACAAIEAHRPRLTAAEDARDATAIRREQTIADTLFDECSAARSRLYALRPSSIRAVTTLLTVIRSAEEDVFEDGELAGAVSGAIEMLQSVR